MAGWSKTNSIAASELRATRSKNPTKGQELFRLKPFRFPGPCTDLGKSSECIRSVVEEIPDLLARLAALVARQTLGGIGKHEFVRLFHRVTTIANFSQHLALL